MYGQDEAYTDWFGYSPAETVGKQLSDFVVSTHDVTRWVISKAQHFQAGKNHVAMTKLYSNTYTVHKKSHTFLHFEQQVSQN